MVGLGGLEPPTSRLSGVRSDQLSYKPMNDIALRYVYAGTFVPAQLLLLHIFCCFLAAVFASSSASTITLLKHLTVLQN